MTDEQKTCEQIIDGELKSRIQDLRLLWASYKRGEEWCKEVESYLPEYGLDFSYTAPNTFRDQAEGYCVYLLSCGGPQDEFRFYPPVSDYDAWRVEYWYLNWYDGAHRVLLGERRRLLIELLEFYDGAGLIKRHKEKSCTRG